MPIEKFYNAHVRFEFRHCSAKDKNDKKLLGFAFLHLMDMDETTVKDGSHSLCLYKCEDVNRFENSAIYLAMPSKLSEVTSLEQVCTYVLLTKKGDVHYIFSSPRFWNFLMIFGFLESSQAYM